MLESIKILGCDYAITEEDRISRDSYTYGSVDYVTQTIKISKELTPQRKAETLLHEVVHTILFEMREVDLSENERFVGIMAATLLQVFRDNPALLAFLGGL